MEMKTITTDVVVIGGGGAACRSAIEVSEKGLDCIMLDKGRPGRSGATHPAHCGAYRRLWAPWAGKKGIPPRSIL